MPNLYRCKIVEYGWMTEYVKQKDYIWANDETEARTNMAKAWGIRRNAKGFKVELVPFKNTTRQKKIIEEYVTETQSRYLGGYDYRYLKKVTHYICKNCGHDSTNRFERICSECGCQFIN